MYHADLVGGLMARIGGVRAIIWGIRHSELNPQTSSRSARLAARLCARLSSWIPSAIICCSAQAASVHQRLGYNASKFAVIPNGYDLSHFSRQPHLTLKLRQEWGIGSQIPLLGVVARWDPHKDHANLLASLALLKISGRDFHCVLAGRGVDMRNDVLRRLISENGLQNKVTLLGHRNDISNIMNAIDLLVLSSCGEAFPNVVAEAMACGTPCVVTDVGDAAMIVANTGWVVPARNPPALAESINNALLAINSPQRETISRACRQRILNCYEIGHMATAYQDVWSRCSSAK
jgi:glycosyltransferase involved in cell wall biosynthesis